MVSSRASSASLWGSPGLRISHQRSPRSPRKRPALLTLSGCHWLRADGRGVALAQTLWTDLPAQPPEALGQLHSLKLEV